MHGAMKNTNKDWTIKDEMNTTMAKTRRNLNFPWTNKYQPNKKSVSEYVYLKLIIAMRAALIGRIKKIKVTAVVVEIFICLILFNI